MITPESYERLKPYRDYILSGAMKGETANAVCDIYDSISNRTSVNRFCNACLAEMVTYLKAHILTYESKAASEEKELARMEEAANKIIKKQEIRKPKTIKR